MNLAFDNSYVRLPEGLYTRQAPAPVAQPSMIRVNQGLARLLGLDPGWLESAAGIAMLAGNRLPPGAEPIAQAYAGHQFGSFNPQLGDGRALLLGELLGADGERYDLQLKGSGPTLYSRMGDGRAPLGPVLREYVVSEAMHALGVPSSRALAAVATGEPVYREEALPGAVLARVALSHIRIGTAQYAAATGDRQALEALIAHVIARHYPDAAGAMRPALALLEQVCRKQAALVAQWQNLGFIHGVMNTDNMLLSGETIDYGPCAFMDAYHPETVYSAIDQFGRYAYRNQPGIAHWNLACLAQALLPALGVLKEEGGAAAGAPEKATARTRGPGGDSAGAQGKAVERARQAGRDNAGAQEGKAVELAKAALDKFPGWFQAARLAGLRAKLGLAEAHDGDEALAEDFLELLQETGSDFTLAFRRLAGVAGEGGERREAPGGTGGESSEGREGAIDEGLESLFQFSDAFTPWLARWRKRLAAEAAPLQQAQARMRAASPALIPRNHLVEQAIASAVQDGDYQPFHELVEALESPFSYRRDLARFARPPKPEEMVRRTFCGT